MNARAAPLRAGRLAAYGVLGLPLAFASLPIYVHVPKLYADTLGLSLSVVGAVLLVARLGDAVIDPLLGRWSDLVGARRRLILWAMLPLTLGMFGLLAPEAEWVGPWWLAATLALVYLGFSLAQLNYCAWGAALGDSAHERTRVTAWREGFALAGVIAASVLPSVLGAGDLAEGLRRTVWVFVVLLAAGALAGVWAPRAAERTGAPPGIAQLIEELRAQPAVAALLGVYALNGIAAAIPATLVLFYIADVLRLARFEGVFLAAYFIAGVAAMPLWLALSKRIGRAGAWGVSMLLAVAVFVWAHALGEGALWPFVAICALSGAALGADLALPPALLADLMARNPRMAASGGALFGVWTLVSKLNLALAAGLALPVLGALGYAPGTREASALAALAAVYALVPVALKCAALALLWRVRHLIGR